MTTRPATSTSGAPSGDELARRYWSLAIRLVRIRLPRPGVDHEQIALDALEHAIRTYDPGRGNFGAWLGWRVRDKVSNHRTAARRLKRAGVTARLDELPPGVMARQSDPARPAAESEAVRAILSAMEPFPRLVLLLHVFDSVSYAAIGRANGVPKETAQHWVASSRGAVRSAVRSRLDATEAIPCPIRRPRPA